MDKKDSKVLMELQRDSKRKVTAIAKETGLPISTTHLRIKKLENLGVIKRYRALIDYIKIGRPVTAFVNVIIGSEKSVKEIAKKLANLEGVEEVHATAGQFDIIAKVRLSSTEELGNLIFEKGTGVRSWEGVERTETMIVFETISENTPLTPKNIKK